MHDRDWNENLIEHRSKRRLWLFFGITILTSFVVEFGIMFALPHVIGSGAPGWLVTVIDAASLSLILSCILLPIIRHLRRLDLSASQRAVRMQSVLNRHAIVSIADKNGDMTFVNDRLCAVSGYDRHELLGQNHRMLKSNKHSKSFFQAMWAEIAAGRTWTDNICNLNKSGKPYWVKTTIMPFLDSEGRIEEYISVRTEITEQKVLEDRLIEQEAWLSTLLYNLAEGVYSLDTRGSLTYLNAEAEKILGWSFEELKGKILHDAIHHHRPDGTDLPADECPIYRSIRNKQIYRSTEEVFFHKDGKAIPIALTAAPLLKNDKIYGTVAVFSNRTEELKSLKLLMETKDAAIRANQAKSDFLSNMSHELRTPLNSIIGFADLLIANKTTPLTDRQRGQVDRIHHGGEFLLQMIDGILDFSKIEAGHVALSVEGIAVRDLIRDCIDLSSPLLIKHDVTLIDEIGDSPTFLLADRVRTKQVILNLLSNAAKYNKKGGTIRLSCSVRDNGMARIKVADTGLGIEPAVKEQIFQPFHRGVAEFMSIEGTGIGLALVRKLLGLMGGEIDFESAPGEGSVFWIDLPIKEQVPDGPSVSKAMKKPTVCGNSAAGQEKRLLYIEDNPANIRLMEDYIAELDGWSVVVARDGDAGLSIAATHKLDMIICDINLPGMTGLEVVRHLRQLPGMTGDFPIYALSADATTKTMDVALEIGFTKYITKPVRLNILKKELDSIRLRTTPDRGKEC